MKEVYRNLRLLLGLVLLCLALMFLGDACIHVARRRATTAAQHLTPQHQIHLVTIRVDGQAITFPVLATNITITVIP